MDVSGISISSRIVFTMRTLLLLSLFCCIVNRAYGQLPVKEPEKVSVTADLRHLLLAYKWSWRNVSAGVPDRECVFVPDGTFRHPHFTAKFTVKNINTVHLNREGGERAIMTFKEDYQSFEVLDFDKKRRITGQRLGKTKP